MLVLPVQAVGKSNEHMLSPGTLSLSADTLLRVLVEIGESVHRAGLRKIVLANSHGGNASVISTATRELRVRFGMLAVATHWRWFGLPEGMYDAVEAKHGIHAGDIETSLMLEFRRDLVRMDKAKNFVSSAIAIEKEFKQLTPAGTHAFGWIAQDLNPDGAVGNAAIATAEKGARTAEHQADGFIDLLRDMTDVLSDPPASRCRCLRNSLISRGRTRRATGSPTHGCRRATIAGAAPAAQADARASSPLTC